MLLLNLGASIWFGVRGDTPWSIIYFGGGLIQFGSLWLTR